MDLLLLDYWRSSEHEGVLEVLLCTWTGFRMLRLKVTDFEKEYTQVGYIREFFTDGGRISKDGPDFQIYGRPRTIPIILFWVVPILCPSIAFAYI